MARTAKELEAKIAELRAAQKKTQARNGWRHYEEKINYLNGELMLQRLHEQASAAAAAEALGDLDAWDGSCGSGCEQCR